MIGVDLSLTATGLADSTKRTGRVGRQGVTCLPIGERGAAMRTLARRIAGWPEAAPSLVVIEGLEAVAGAGNGASAERHYLWWVMVTHWLSHGTPVATVHPTRLKLITTGSGRAGKPEITNTVRSWGFWDPGRDHNQADAAALCRIGAGLAGMTIPGVPPVDPRMLAAIRSEPAWSRETINA